MKRSDRRKRAFVVAAAAAAAFTPALAQNVDMAALQRWGALTVVHDHVVGAYDADFAVAGAHAKRDARVKDRIEIDFDWNQSEMKMIGKAAVRNRSDQAARGTTFTGRSPMRTRRHSFA